METGLYFWGNLGSVFGLLGGAAPERSLVKGQMEDGRQRRGDGSSVPGEAWPQAESQDRSEVRPPRSALPALAAGA